MTHELPEKATIPLTLGTAANPTVTDSSGDTVGAYLVNESGTATLVGTASGAAAGTPFTINMDLSVSGIVPALYTLEVVSSINDANPETMVPNVTVGRPVYIRIFEVKALP